MSVRKPVAFLPDSDVLGGSDVPGLELAAGPGVATLAAGGVEGF